MIYDYRKGRLIQSTIKIRDRLCYIGQYFEGGIWIDLSYDNGEHIYGYTIVGFDIGGIKLCDPSEYISYIDEITPYKLKIIGVDET
jgi:hypothetical protein